MIISQLEKGVSLRFADASLEARFAQDYSDRFVVQLRFALVLGMIFMFGDAAIDFAFDREDAFRANMFRVFFVIPFAAFSLGVTFLPRARPYLEAYCSIAIVIVAIGLFWAMLLLERDGGLGLSSWVGALNYSFVLLFVFLILGIRFARALLVGTIITLMFLGATFIVLDAGRMTMWQYGYHVVTVFILCAFLGFWRERFVRRVYKAQMDLNEERARTDSILYELIPSRIVEDLKKDGPPIAEPVGEATVLFADIQGFTDLANRVGPEHLLEVLDRIFHSFDDICDAHDIDKVKIIGDCYMAVATLRSGPDAAIRAMRCAILWQEATNRLGEELGLPLKLRIGAHTGSIIGGVIGARRWSYDYWGNTVNVASRLQEASEPDTLLISEATYLRCRNQLDASPVGEIELRGYGTMECYRVTAVL